MKPGITIGHGIGLTLAGSSAIVGLALFYFALVVMGVLTVPAWAVSAITITAIIVGSIACLLGVLFLVLWAEPDTLGRSARH